MLGAVTADVESVAAVVSATVVATSVVGATSIVVSAADDAGLVLGGAVGSAVAAGAVDAAGGADVLTVLLSELHAVPASSAAVIPSVIKPRVPLTAADCTRPGPSAGTGAFYRPVRAR
ncbi:MAG: hypothetical protein JWN39_3645 [Ilumatobacteraceae bacterium]|nr:hypothetical protein [Ilumatobacteraceae bacterium]